jgi:uncharacterized protein YcfJ
MKRLITASLFATTLIGAQAQTFNDNARVRSAEPQYENVSVPRNECTNHWVDERGGRGGYERQTQNQPQDRNYGGAIVGGLAGGVIGHQIGGGAGKDAATALGVVLGAIAGDRMGNNQEPRVQYDSGPAEITQREVRRCRTVYDTQTRITGYKVTYDYHGQTYATFMRSNPGNSLPVRVTVDPVVQ